MQFCALKKPKSAIESLEKVKNHNVNLKQRNFLILPKTLTKMIIILFLHAKATWLHYVKVTSFACA